jgi:hypothetical protein
MTLTVGLSQSISSRLAAVTHERRIYRRGCGTARRPVSSAIGRTLIGAGVQIAFASGVTHTFGNLNAPVNLPVAPGRPGASVSVTSGFNTRRRA